MIQSLLQSRGGLGRHNRPHLLCSLGVRVLHKRLEALPLLKSGNLLDQAEGAEYQMQRVQRH